MIACALGLVAGLAPGCSEPPYVPDDAAGTITVQVTTNEAPGTPPGVAIPGASVLIDRGRHGVERLTTDGEGTAQFAAADVVAYHVVHPVGRAWQVYTVSIIGPGTVQLGGRATLVRYHTMTLTVPAASSVYRVHAPRACLVSELGVARPSLTLAYRASCEGQRARVYAYAGDASSPGRVYLDGGELALVDGGAGTLAGSYAPPEASALQIANLAAGVSSVSAEVVARSPAGFTVLAETVGTVSPQAGSATLAMSAPPGGDLLRVRVSGGSAAGLQSASARIVPVASLAPAAGGAPSGFDAATVPPLFDAITADEPGALAWTGGGAGGTITIAVALGGATHWEALLPPSATAVRFPVLPADLAAAAPPQLDFASIDKLEIPGTTAAELVSSIDQRWPGWPEDPALVPPEGGSRVELRYRRGEPAR